jgi:hypothetical protein
LALPLVALAAAEVAAVAPPAAASQLVRGALSNHGRAAGCAIIQRVQKESNEIASREAP